MTIGVAPPPPRDRYRSISIDRYLLLKLKGTIFFFSLSLLQSSKLRREITSFVPLNGFPSFRSAELCRLTITPLRRREREREREILSMETLSSRQQIRWFVREVAIHPAESRKFPSISYLRKTLSPPIHDPCTLLANRRWSHIIVSAHGSVSDISIRHESAIMNSSGWF